MSKSKARAKASASVANVAVGFDLLGFSVPAAFDEVSVEKTTGHDIEIVDVTGVVTQVPKDPTKNTATAGLVRLRSEHKLDFGFRVSIKKGIPLGSGMGGSAASAVAAIVAANECLDQKLSRAELLSYALIGEAQASGSYHADNIAPSLIGGLTMARVRGTSSSAQVDAVSIPVPKNVYCVLVHPHVVLETKIARGVLAHEVPLKKHVEQSANLAGFIAGCFQNDLDLIKRSFNDVVVEPQRASLIVGFNDVKEAAMRTGAMGCSISGAGPSVFAWVEGLELAKDVEKEMIGAFASAGPEATSWVVPLANPGAQVIE